jgi:predicted acetyltransferase
MEETTAQVMEHHPPRIYSPLADSDEIRLLLLHPGSGDDSIKCSIQLVKLSNKPQYEALSYMWGPKDYKSIEINGRVCEVRENLYQALLHLRLHDKEEGFLNRAFWIDALCLYADRYQKKYSGNLRYRPLYSERFHSTHLGNG